jgi:RNA polymerase sigma-70 factor (ECF subfamily)
MMVEGVPELAAPLRWVEAEVSAVASSARPPDVAAWVARARRNDEEAARLLIAHLYPLVIKLVRAYLPRRSSEEDLAQTVFMKIFARLGQYSGRVPLERWVSRVTINTCLNQLSAERVRPELRWADLTEEQCFVVESLAATHAELPADEGLAARDLTEKLLEMLAPAERLLISLLYLEGHTPREVARITGWNSALIRARAFRARRKIRKRFKSLLGEARP